MTIPALAPMRVEAVSSSGSCRRVRVVSSVAAARNVATAAQMERQRSAGARAAALDDYVVRRMLADRASVAVPAGSEAASDRFGALRRRVIAREAAARGVLAMPPAPSWLGPASAVLESPSDLGS